MAAFNLAGRMLGPTTKSWIKPVQTFIENSDCKLEERIALEFSMPTCVEYLKQY